MHTNARSQELNLQATVPGFGTVWIDKDAIANIFRYGDLVVEKKMKLSKVEWFIMGNHHMRGFQRMMQQVQEHH